MTLAVLVDVIDEAPRPVARVRVVASWCRGSMFRARELRRIACQHNADKDSEQNEAYDV